MTGGLGAGLVLAIVLAGLAFWQRGIAVEQEGIAKQATQRAETERDAAQAAQKDATAQRNRAEKVLAAATDTARSLVVDLAVKFREVKGIPLDVVQGILNKSKGLLDQLESFKENSPSVLLNRVETLSELGLHWRRRAMPRADSSPPRPLTSPISSDANSPGWRASITPMVVLRKSWASSRARQPAEGVVPLPERRRRFCKVLC